MERLPHNQPIPPFPSFGPLRIPFGSPSGSLEPSQRRTQTKEEEKEKGGQKKQKKTGNQQALPWASDIGISLFC